MSSVFVWDDNFITDLVSVDDQHHELVDWFNALHSAMLQAQGLDCTQLEQVYARLIDYTNYHFTEEEQLMRDSGLDPRHITVHQHLHAQFVEQVQMLWAQRASLSDAPETLLGFLSSWLGLHILGIDQSMARQMQWIAQGHSAAEAFELERQSHDKSAQALLKVISKLYGVLSSQNMALLQSNAELEARVAQRTEALERANAQLSVLSRTDGLLKIANRACWDERLAQACAHSLRSQQPLGVLMIDVDYFKRYNDCYGHQRGDACLQAVAAAVQGCVQRETDLLARYGGEELAVLLPGTDAAGVQAMAARIVACVQALGLLHAQSECCDVVTVSVGAASGVPPAGPSGASAGSRLLALADAALYQSKQQGRNRWCWVSAHAAPAPEPQASLAASPGQAA